MKIKPWLLAISLVFGTTMALNANTAPAPASVVSAASAPVAAAPGHHDKDKKSKKVRHKADFPCNDWCTAAICKGQKKVINVCKAKGNKCSNLPVECKKYKKKDKPDTSAFNCEKLCTEGACYGRPNAISACQANCKGKNIPEACVGKFHKMKNNLNQKLNEVKGRGHELQESVKSILSSK